MNDGHDHAANAPSQPGAVWGPVAWVSAGVLIAAGLGYWMLAPRNFKDMAKLQAKLSDSNQAELWADLADEYPKKTARGLFDPKHAVSTRQVSTVPNLEHEPRRVPFSETVRNGFVLFTAPAPPIDFTGRALLSQKGEFLKLDLGEGRAVELQAKVRGGPVCGCEGCSEDCQNVPANVVFRSSGSLRRPGPGDAVLIIELADDLLFYGVFSAERPLAVEVEELGLRARQLESLSGPPLPVEVRVGTDDPKVLAPAQQADFPQAGLTVKIVVSMALGDESRHLLPGPRYRFEIHGWRTK
jgi:hypothetical protein